jgi:hypothetical protein
VGRMAGMRYALLIACVLVATMYRPAMCTAPISASDAFADSTRVVGAIRGSYANMNVLPPCHVPSVDTTGWQTIHRPLNEGRFTFKLPPSFRRDERFKYGRIAWIDGRRGFAVVIPAIGSYGCSMNYTPGCSECVDTLATIPWRLVTASQRWDSLYRVVAVDPPDASPTGWYTQMEGTSPDSLDQGMFLAIFRTLQRDTTSR